MDNIFNAGWIKSARDRKDAALTFYKRISLKKRPVKAELEISALGVYNCYINSRRINDEYFAPGWTDYNHRLQYARIDITRLMRKSNTVEIKVGQGWRFHGWYDKNNSQIHPCQPAVIAAFRFSFADGHTENVYTDGTWRVMENETRYNNMYNGELIDYTYVIKRSRAATQFYYDKDILIPEEGVPVKERERFTGQRLIITPKGEKVIDFGQEITGWVSFPVHEKAGTEITLQHFEMLDRDGNVYTENLRSAKAQFTVICDGEEHTAKPEYTFFGFRYIEVRGMEDIKPEDFTAIAVYSDVRKISRFECSSPLINQLYSNILWGQRGNFLDVPTDCPQRDERLGWTGDAQVFCKTASYNFDVEKFFAKWFGDLRTTQLENGEIPHYVPSFEGEGGGSAAWGDVAVIAPWQMYLSYGDKKILSDNFEMMEKWIDYMKTRAAKRGVDSSFKKSRNMYLHNNSSHLGDWLALDLPDLEAVGGATPTDLIATAFFAYSTSLVAKVCRVLERDSSYYDELYKNIRKAYIGEFLNEDGTLKADTQTACVLTLFFGLTDKPEAAAKQLTDNIRACGHLKTGFVGTPYLLHVLSDIGESSLAYDLLLREEFPSWGYTIKQGATTMWERWNGKKPDGSFADVGMNSFNHYAYGAVGDWMMEHMAGIQPQEDGAGFTKIIFAPETDSRFTFVRASIRSRAGMVKSEWEITDGKTNYKFYVPERATAEAIINGKKYALLTGMNKISL